MVRLRSCEFRNIKKETEVMIEDLHERDRRGINKENNKKQRELTKEELFNFWYQAFSLVASLDYKNPPNSSKS